MQNKINLLYEILSTRLRYRILLLGISFIAAASGLMAPILQKEFIDILLGSVQSEYLRWFNQFPLATLILLSCGCLLLSQGLTQLSNYLGAKESLLMQRRLADHLYQKTLELKIDSLGNYQTGNIVSLYTTDVPAATVLLDQTLPFGASTFFPFILAPITISLLLKIPVWPTLTLMFFATGISIYLSFLQSKFFLKFKSLAADRIGLVSEWIQALRTIRVLGWVTAFENQIFEMRERETLNRIAMVTNGQIMNSVSTSVSFFLNIVAILSLLYLTDRQPTSGELLATLWIVGLFLIRPFRQLPWFFTFAFDAWTSISRLEKFLQKPNTIPHFLKQVPNQESDQKTGLKVENLNLRINDQPILKNISFQIEPGEFVAVVGPVGSGKSLLLLSLLGETGAHFEKYQIGEVMVTNDNLKNLRNSFVFVPQEGFIMSATLAENVEFEYDDYRMKSRSPEAELRIQEALQISQFDLDQESFVQGLSTKIGERGVNLSGGQKQRVTLARGLQHFLKSMHPNNPETGTKSEPVEESIIILLDDCLSALDVNTEEAIIRELLMGKWAKTSRLLVTHRLDVLHYVDRVLFFKEGQLKAQGAYEELLIQNKEFAEFMKSSHHNESYIL